MTWYKQNLESDFYQKWSKDNSSYEIKFKSKSVFDIYITNIIKILEHKQWNILGFTRIRNKWPHVLQMIYALQNLYQQNN